MSPKYLLIGAAALLSICGLTSGTGVAQTADAGAAEETERLVGDYPVPQATGTCVVNRLKYRTETGLVSTTSTTSAAVPNSVITLNLTNPGCIIVRFSAETNVIGKVANGGINLSAVLDGTATALPGPVFWTRDHDEDNDGAGFRVQAFEFVFPSVAAGSHNVSIFWSTNVSGQTAQLWFRTLTVNYRP